MSGSITSDPPSTPPASGSSSGIVVAFTATERSVIRPSAPNMLTRAMAEETTSRIFAPGLLDGEVCVVSGAGTGLGRATALELAGLGRP